MSSTKCKGNLSANWRSLASVPSASARQPTGRPLSATRLSCRRSKPACRAAVACVHSRPESCPGHRSPERRSAAGWFHRSGPSGDCCRGTCPPTWLTGLASTRFFAVRYDTAASIGRLRSYRRRPGRRSGGRQELCSSVEGRCRAVAHSVASGGLMKRSAGAAIRRRGEAGPSWRPGVISHHDGKFEFDPGSNGQQQAKSP
jgi:hypothetical protein